MRKEAALLFLLLSSGCSESNSKDSVKGVASAKAGSATVVNCEDITPLNYKECTDRVSDLTMRLADMERLVKSPYINEKYTQHLSHIINTINLLGRLRAIEFYQVRSTHDTPSAIYGCKEPFWGSIISPLDDPDSDAQILGIKIHEADHLVRAYDRSQMGQTCISSNSAEVENEEYQVQFDTLYFAGLARKVGFKDKTSAYLVAKDGSDPMEIVYSVLVPNSIGPLDNLTDLLLNKLPNRYFWLHSGLSRDFIPSEVLKSISRTEAQWKQFILSSSPKDKESLRLMREMKLIAADFLPSMP